jgi:hypothetical protein
LGCRRGSTEWMPQKPQHHSCLWTAHSHTGCGAPACKPHIMHPCLVRYTTNYPARPACLPSLASRYPVPHSLLHHSMTGVKLPNPAAISCASAPMDQTKRGCDVCRTLLRAAEQAGPIEHRMASAAQLKTKNNQDKGSSYPGQATDEARWY